MRAYSADKKNLQKACPTLATKFCSNNSNFAWSAGGRPDKKHMIIRDGNIKRSQCKRRSKILALGGQRNFVALLAVDSVKSVEISLSTDFYGGNRSVYGHESMDTNSTSGFSRWPLQAEGLPGIQHQLGYSTANIGTFFTAGLSTDGSDRPAGHRALAGAA